MFTKSTIRIQDILHGYARINYQVDGYWSRETITVYVDRRMDWETKKVIWVANVNHSTGGRDKEQVADDNEATRNFAHALMDAAYQADLIMANTEGLELAYKANEHARKMLRTYEEEAFQAKLALDPALGEEFAEKMVKQMRDEIKGNLERDPWLVHYVTRPFRSRVHNRESIVEAYSTNSVNPKIRFKINGEAASMKYTKEFISNMSAHNTFEAVLGS